MIIIRAAEGVARLTNIIKLLLSDYQLTIDIGSQLLLANNTFLVSLRSSILILCRFRNDLFLVKRALPNRPYTGVHYSAECVFSYHIQINHVLQETARSPLTRVDLSNYVSIIYYTILHVKLAGINNASVVRKTKRHKSFVCSKPATASVLSQLHKVLQV